MQAEIEVKYLNVNVDDIRKRLEAAGAHLEHPMRQMKRALIEEPHHAKESMFIRIRDEGDRVTLCLKKKTKELMEATIDSTFEIETTVGDFDTTVQIFDVAGWKYTTFQESKRETWVLDGAEIVIDEWPWINPYIEIEADTEEIVRSVSDKLGFSWDDAVFGSVDVVYNMEYPDMTVRGVIDIKEVRFNEPSPAEFGARS